MSLLHTDLIQIANNIEVILEHINNSISRETAYYYPPDTLKEVVSALEDKVTTLRTNLHYLTSYHQLYKKYIKQVTNYKKNQQKYVDKLQKADEYVQKCIAINNHLQTNIRPKLIGILYLFSKCYF